MVSEQSILELTRSIYVTAQEVMEILGSMKSNLKSLKEELRKEEKWEDCEEHEKEKTTRERDLEKEIRDLPELEEIDNQGLIVEINESKVVMHHQSNAYQVTANFLRDESRTLKFEIPRATISDKGEEGTRADSYEFSLHPISGWRQQQDKELQRGQTQMKDRDRRERSELIDGQPSPPSSLSPPPSPPPPLSPPPLASRVTKSRNKMSFAGKPILILLWPNPNPENCIWPKTLLGITVWPKPMMDLKCSIHFTSICLTTNRVWLDDLHWKLPPPWPPPAFTPPPPPPALALTLGNLKESVKFLAKEKFMKKLQGELDLLNVGQAKIVEGKIEIDILGRRYIEIQFQIILDSGRNNQVKRAAETNLHFGKIVNDHMMRRACCQTILKDMQLWGLNTLKSCLDGHDNVLNYLLILIQRLMVTAGVIPCSPNILNQMNINKNFKDVDASTAFGGVFDAGLTQRHVRVTSLAQETQMTSSLLGNLVDVMEEIQLGSIELKNLIPARFPISLDEGPYLNMYFLEPNSQKKATVTLTTSCWKRGVYPSTIVPCSSTFGKHEPKLGVTLLSDKTLEVCNIYCDVGDHVSGDIIKKYGNFCLVGRLSITVEESVGHSCIFTPRMNTRLKGEAIAYVGKGKVACDGYNRVSPTRKNIDVDANTRIQYWTKGIEDSLLWCLVYHPKQRIDSFRVAGHDSWVESRFGQEQLDECINWQIMGGRRTGALLILVLALKIQCYKVVRQVMLARSGLVLKGKGGFFAVLFGVRRKTNGGRLLGTMDTTSLEWGLKLDWKDSSVLEANWEYYVIQPKRSIFYLFWSIALEGKGSLLAKHRGIKVSTCWCKEEIDRLLGTKATSLRFSITAVYRFLFFFFPP